MSRTILAIDDELHMLRLLEQLIDKRTPHRITTTHNALEVPGLLEKQEFDVIITDLRMPGLSGMDILRLVHEKRRVEEVIMITAFGTLESATEAMSLGVFDYITKPFKKEQLLDAIEGAMEWRDLCCNAAGFIDLLQMKPYAEAEQEFRQAYVSRLSAGLSGDGRLVAEQSGIPQKEIEIILHNEEN
ncbi:MAG: response regulator [FCB group bacterium]|nr:response regulator [FCB group bacterium]